MVRLMMAHVRPKFDMDMNEFNKLIADLDSETYSVRQAARKTLDAKSKSIWPLMQEALTQTTSTEVRTALEVLLSQVGKATPVQEMYAMRILERVDTDLARESIRWSAAAPETSNLGKLGGRRRPSLGLHRQASRRRRRLGRRSPRSVSHPDDSFISLGKFRAQAPNPKQTTSSNQQIEPNRLPDPASSRLCLSFAFCCLSSCLEFGAWDWDLPLFIRFINNETPPGRLAGGQTRASAFSINHRDRSICS